MRTTSKDTLPWQRYPKTHYHSNNAKPRYVNTFDLGVFFQSLGAYGFCGRKTTTTTTTTEVFYWCLFLCLFSVLSVPDDNRSTTHEKRVVSRFSCFPEVVQFGISKHWSTIFGGHRLFSYFSDFYVPLTDLGYFRTNGTFTVTQAETGSPQDESLIHSHTGVTTGRITHSQSHRTNHSFTVTQAETGSPQDESHTHSHTVPGRNATDRDPNT